MTTMMMIKIYLLRAKQANHSSLHTTQKCAIMKETRDARHENEKF